MSFSIHFKVTTQYKAETRAFNLAKVKGLTLKFSRKTKVAKCQDDSSLLIIKTLTFARVLSGCTMRIIGKASLIVLISVLLET